MLCLATRIVPPSFKLSFLLPKYWLVWVGVILLYALTWLPYPAINLLGKGVGKLLTKIVPKRVAVAQRNLELCYPNWSNEKRQRVLTTHLQRAGMALFETAMGWWWPQWRIERISEVEGFEHAEAILRSGKGVFGLALHNMNLELACRVVGLKHPSIAFYRKHNNELIDYFQYHGRNRSNKYMIHKRSSKALIEAMNEGELCLYLPDQDYGAKQSIFVPFGSVKHTATTTATLMFAERANCVPLIITSQYSDKGCKIKFYPPINWLTKEPVEQALTRLNEEIYEIVSEQPESYLWMHKRFKTRPSESDPSLY